MEYFSFMQITTCCSVDRNCAPECTNQHRSIVEPFFFLRGIHCDSTTLINQLIWPTFTIDCNLQLGWCCMQGNRCTRYDMPEGELISSVSRRQYAFHLIVYFRFYLFIAGILQSGWNSCGWEFEIMQICIDNYMWEPSNAHSNTFNR